MRILDPNLTKQRIPGRRDGGVLVIALMAVCAVAALTAGLLQLNQATTKRQNSSTNTKLAFYAAESGLAEAYAGLQVGKTGNVGTAAEPAAFGNSLFWVEATENEDGTVDLTSTGMAGNGRAILSVVFKRNEPSVATLGFFSPNRLDVPPGSIIDGYDSEVSSYQSQLIKGLAPEGAGRMGSNDFIDVSGEGKNPTLINGSLTPGPSHQVNVKGKVIIMGSTEPALETTALPPVMVPDIPILPGVTHDSPVPLLLLPGKTGIEYLDVQVNCEVIIKGPSTLVIGGLRLAAESQLSFDTTDGSVEVYVIEELVLQPESAILTSSQDPSMVTIQIAGKTAEPALLASNASFHGVVYGPEADVTVASSFELFGALIANNLEFNGPVRLHFDQYLDRLSAEAALPSFLSWRIVDLSKPKGALLGSDPFSYLGVEKSTLPKPAEAHADQLIHVEYKDLANTAKVYDGMESGFDWNKVKSVQVLIRDGNNVKGGGKWK